MLEVAGLDPLQRARRNPCSRLGRPSRPSAPAWPGRNADGAMSFRPASASPAIGRPCSSPFSVSSASPPACSPSHVQAHPCLVAVLVDKEAYLFDPRMGLPVPTADHEGVATWTQLRDQPELGNFVDLDPAQITQLPVAHGPAGSHCRRAWSTWSGSSREEANVGGDRIVLHVDVAQSERVFAEAGLRPIGLWRSESRARTAARSAAFSPRGGRGPGCHEPACAVHGRPGAVGALLRPIREAPAARQAGPARRRRSNAVAQLDKVTAARKLFDLYLLQPQEMLGYAARPRRCRVASTRSRRCSKCGSHRGEREVPHLGRSTAKWHCERFEARRNVTPGQRRSDRRRKSPADSGTRTRLDWLQRPARELPVKASSADLPGQADPRASRTADGAQVNYLPGRPVAGQGGNRPRRWSRYQRRLGEESKVSEQNAVDALEERTQRLEPIRRARPISDGEP